VGPEPQLTAIRIPIPVDIVKKQKKYGAVVWAKSAALQRRATIGPRLEVSRLRKIDFSGLPKAGSRE
jgi:hypothetical protein